MQREKLAHLISRNLTAEKVIDHAKRAGSPIDRKDSLAFLPKAIGALRCQ